MMTQVSSDETCMRGKLCSVLANFALSVPTATTIKSRSGRLLVGNRRGPWCRDRTRKTKAHLRELLHNPTSRLQVPVESRYLNTSILLRFTSVSTCRRFGADS
ncbi:hypothetical protein ANCCAN_17279 [Ancylostoma caninum]|uniref:Uncharacterized protein n=1 Tax=Ancylostoma caninum TaxID=29170 RepID=A0A368FXC5_ANCCA|nr:hypothetical protein ANCCAN_17279 [Ancylostoma caninum]